MQPRAVHVRHRSSNYASPRAALASDPENQVGRYWLTRRVHGGGALELFRAAASGDLGPGGYILKRTSVRGRSPEIAAAMLQREATVAATVEHPNLNCILAAHLDAPRPHLLLPFRDGLSLRQFLDSSNGRFSVSRALNLARQVAQALAAMHAAGWLHGQLRPEHVLLSPQAHVVVIDLTLARRLDTHECDSSDFVVTHAPY